LGLDATVVWGVKDLRIQNNLPAMIMFSFEVDDTCIVGRVLSDQPLKACELFIDLRPGDISGSKQVTVSRTKADGSSEVLSRDNYLPLPSKTARN
jgi:vancomycin resistance protein YoaR